MRITDKLRAEHDGRQWILYETYTGVDRAGNPKEHQREYYYGNIGQVFRKVIDKSVTECEDLSKVLEALVDLKLLLEDKLQDPPKKVTT